MRNYHKLPAPQSSAPGDVVGTLSGDGSGVVLVIQPGGAVMVPVNPQYEIDNFGNTKDQYKAVKTHGSKGKLHRAGHP